MYTRHAALGYLTLLVLATFAETARAEEPAAQTEPKEAPLAGYHNGTFYLRDRSDTFRLYLQGRAQIDSYNYLGPGVAHVPATTSTLLLRRIRPEIGGELAKHFQFMLAGDWGQTGNDNVTGTNETSAAPAGTAPTATSGKYASAQTSTFRAQAADVWLAYSPVNEFHVQVGQYDAPFSMENRTSDKYIPFMERSLAVRALGIPTNKEMGLMAFGELFGGRVYYSGGVFNGDGQNRLSPDDRIDGMGRIFVKPFAGSRSAFSDVQVGGSARLGSRDGAAVNYDYPAMTTQSGVPFWKPTYSGSSGVMHVIPSGAQRAAGAELRVPVGMFDVTSELVHVNNDTREAHDGAQSTSTDRLGAMRGYAYYAQLGVWVIGDRSVIPAPGYERAAHLDLEKPEKTPQHALQLLVKWEQLRVTYDSAARGGVVDSKTLDGDIRVDALSVGANAWITSHVRLTANYVLSMFPDSAPASATVPGGHGLHEVLFRAAVAF